MCWYYIRNANSSRRSVQSSESSEPQARQPAHSEASRMSGRGSYLREQVPCRQCGGDCAGVTATGVRAVTTSQRCEPGWTPEEMAAGQDADPDIGPIMRWKRAGNDRPRWEDISAESREAKVLWRQWEQLYLVGGVLHRRFHELEGQGWRPQLVLPADRCSIILQRFHGGVIGAHLGTARTLALAWDAS